MICRFNLMKNSRLVGHLSTCRIFCLSDNNIYNRKQNGDLKYDTIISRKLRTKWTQTRMFVKMCIPSLTLAKLPSPILLPMMYPPTFLRRFSSSYRSWAGNRGTSGFTFLVIVCWTKEAVKDCGTNIKAHEISEIFINVMFLYTYEILAMSMHNPCKWATKWFNSHSTWCSVQARQSLYSIIGIRKEIDCLA